jgi:hypothetical protein
VVLRKGVVVGQVVLPLNTLAIVDPETSTYGNSFAQGIQFFDYPKARVFTAGLNVTL